MKSKRNLKGWVEYEIHPSADDLAEVFWSMDAEEQAFFFSKLGEKEELPMQLQYVTDNEYLSESGRRAMGLIGQFIPTFQGGVSLEVSDEQ